MIATLVSALAYRHNGLTVLCLFVQGASFAYYIASFVPGAQRCLRACSWRAARASAEAVVNV